MPISTSQQTPTTPQGQETQSGPTVHTYKLMFEEVKGDPNGGHVTIVDSDKFWAKVKKGDRIQFVPDPSLPNASKIQIEVTFEASPGKTALPLDVITVSSSAVQHDVVDETRDFVAWCWLYINGKKVGYGTGNDGGHPCINC